MIGMVTPVVANRSFAAPPAKPPIGAHVAVRPLFATRIPWTGTVVGYMEGPFVIVEDDEERMIYTIALSLLLPGPMLGA